MAISIKEMQSVLIKSLKDTTISNKDKKYILYSAWNMGIITLEEREKFCAKLNDCHNKNKSKYYKSLFCTPLSKD